jgi:hypothetical protein
MVLDPMLYLQPRGNEMQKKRAYLVCVITALMTFGQAMAQSSHDAVSGKDADLKHAASDRFEVVSADGKYRLGFRGLLQENNKFSYTVNSEKKNIDIELNRARILMYGHVLDPRLTFGVQTALEKEQATGKVATLYKAPGTDYLRDYYLNMAFHHNYFQLRIGKFNLPSSRQHMMSSSQSQFYNESAASDAFRITNTGKDVGIMAHNTFDNPFEWALAVTSNGVSGRVGFNHHGIDGYDMVDWTGGNVRFGVGANGFAHTDYRTTKLADMRGGIDFIAKVAGFSTNGAFYYQWAKQEEKVKHHLGLGLDLGYLIKSRFEPVLRYSWHREGEGVHDNEVLGGLNYYIHGHHLKVQSYIGANLAGKEISQWLGGVQIQLAI